MRMVQPSSRIKKCLPQVRSSRIFCLTKITLSHLSDPPAAIISLPTNGCASSFKITSDGPSMQALLQKLCESYMHTDATRIQRLLPRNFFKTPWPVFPFGKNPTTPLMPLSIFGWYNFLISYPYGKARLHSKIIYHTQSGIR